MGCDKDKTHILNRSNQNIINMANIKISTVEVKAKAKAILVDPAFVTKCCFAKTDAHRLIECVNSMLQTPYEDEWKLQILLNDASDLSDFVDSLMEAIGTSE